MSHLIGIDVSTTAVKALLTDPDKGGGAEVVASANTETPLQTPRPLWSEQGPEDRWRGAQRSLGRLLADAAVRVTGSTTPRSTATARYDDLYRLHHSLYPSLRP